MKRSPLSSRRLAGEPMLRVEEASALLAQCRKVDEAKGIRDQAAAIERYLRQQAASRDAQNDAAEIKVRAERRLGELLADQQETGARAKPGRPGKPSRDGTVSAAPATLQELGIPRQTAARWGEMAAIAEPRFEAHLRAQREKPDGEITSAGVRRELVSEVRRAAKVEAIAAEAAGPLPTKQFLVLYGDPPWRYDQDGGNGAAEGHYPTMSADEICALPVGDCAAKHSALFLWATNPLLPEALRVMDAWGFKYRTNLAWMKDRPGTGHWVRGKHELLLLGIRGSFPTPAPADRPQSVIEAPVGRHSAKPPEAVAAIERMFPGVSKLELFAREPRKGWAAWGNQAAARLPASQVARELFPKTATPSGPRATSSRRSSPARRK